MSCVRGFAGQRHYGTFSRHCVRFPKEGAFCVRQTNKFIGERVCRRVVTAEDMGDTCVCQRQHHSGSLSNLARFFQAMAYACERRLRMAKQPQGQRLIGQNCHPGVLAKSRRQRTMFGGIVKCERPIVVR